MKKSIKTYFSSDDCQAAIDFLYAYAAFVEVNRAGPLPVFTAKHLGIRVNQLQKNDFNENALDTYFSVCHETAAVRRGDDAFLTVQYLRSVASQSDIATIKSLWEALSDPAKALVAEDLFSHHLEGLGLPAGVSVLSRQAA